MVFVSKICRTWEQTEYEQKAEEDRVLECQGWLLGHCQSWRWGPGRGVGVRQGLAGTLAQGRSLLVAERRWWAGRGIQSIFSCFYNLICIKQSRHLCFHLWDQNQMTKRSHLETSLVVQWLRLWPPNAGGGLGSIPGQETSSLMSQLRVLIQQLKILHITIKTQHI